LASLSWKLSFEPTPLYWLADRRSSAWREISSARARAAAARSSFVAGRSPPFTGTGPDVLAVAAQTVVPSGVGSADDFLARSIAARAKAMAAWASLMDRVVRRPSASSSCRPRFFPSPPCFLSSMGAPWPLSPVELASLSLRVSLEGDAVVFAGVPQETDWSLSATTASRAPIVDPPSSLGLPDGLGG
jgi:hypothetical protein